MEKLISVIVPVYNAELYLEKSVGSILAQTYQNLEVILVNDGSSDASAHICRSFVRLDGRVCLVEKKNGGVTSARKAGVKLASGAFICCVDADDWLEPDYFAQAMRVQEESGADIVACAHFQDVGAVSKKNKNGVPAGVYDQASILPKMILGDEFFEFGIHPMLSTKFIRREIFEKVQMKVEDGIFLGEDGAVTYLSILEANRIAVSEVCGYHYVQHQGSAMKTVRRDDMKCFTRLIRHLETAFREKDVMEIMQPQLEQYQKFFFLLRNMQALDCRILLPYGGIPLHCRLILYGAGGFGQQIHQYLSEGNLAEIVMWVDQNFEHYRKSGMHVQSPEAIRSFPDTYDFILIAHTLESTAESIRRYLLSLKVPQKKVRWLSREFLQGKICVNL
ncbi:MAG: glycosyltransferase family 2 protein [Oscillibacter sp.]|nr:glycosyltransferase family 2 protein [Oscillibacter sp.]